MNSKWLMSIVCALFALLALGGCCEPADEPVIIDVPEGEAGVRHSIVGTSIENRAIECLMVGEGQDVTFILTAIHGDEPAGIPLVYRLAKYLRQCPHLLQGRKVVLLPVANPDGVAHNNRLNARGVDLNRNFPTANRINNAVHGYAAISEPEARVIEQLIGEYAPERIVSIHQLTDTGPEALSHRVPKGCIDYDGPAKALAERMAEYCDLPVEKLGAAPGSLGAYTGLTLGIGIITVELPRYAEWLGSERLWEQYGAALIAAVVYPEAVKQEQHERGAVTSGAATFLRRLQDTTGRSSLR